MKLLIFNFPDLNNYGTGMMGMNAIHYLRRIFNREIDFTCDFDINFDIDQLHEEIGMVRPSPTRLSRPVVASALWKKIIHKIRRIWTLLFTKREIQAYDGIIVLGGDNLSECYGREIWKSLFQLAVWSFHKPVIFLGQSMGPFDYWINRGICRLLLRNCHIFVRDNWSLRYLAEEFGLKKNVQQSADLAFLDLPHQGDASLWQNLEKEYNLHPDEYVTIVISALQGGFYTSDRSAYLEAWHKIIVDLLNHPRLLDKKICLLAHTFGDYGDEGILIQKILKLFNAQEKSRLISITEKILPTRARLVLGNGLFTITGRMHAAVSTLQMGKPAVSLAYSNKYYGVIGENLGRGDLIVDANHSESWTNGVISSNVLAKVNYLLGNYNGIVNEIAAAVAKQKILASDTFGQIARIMNGPSVPGLSRK